jgi:hypothetical protein
MVNKQISNLFQAQSNSIASYNYTDIAEGTGSVSFYLLGFQDSSGDINTLSQVAVEGKESSDGWSSTSYVNFDCSPFNHPRVIKGRAYFSGEANHKGTNGTITATLCHYDGTTETTIGTEATTTTISGDWNFCLGFNVSRTHFKKGDILRIKIKMSTSNLYLNLDASGTAEGAGGVNPCRVTVPFEIDL